jgi:hypothetical protein
VAIAREVQRTGFNESGIGFAQNLAVLQSFLSSKTLAREAMMENQLELNQKNRRRRKEDKKRTMNE